MLGYLFFKHHRIYSSRHTEIFYIEKQRKHKFQYVFMNNINISGIRENLFESLKEMLSASPGKVPIYLHLDTPTKSRIHMVVGEGLYVEPKEELIKDIDLLLGADRLSLVL